MERGILRTFKPDGTPVEVYDAEALTKAEFTVFNTYSTDEIDTGKKWIDGNPIFRTVVYCGGLPNGNPILKQVIHNIQNIKFVVYYYGIAYDDGAITNNPHWEIIPYINSDLSPDKFIHIAVHPETINLVSRFDRSYYETYVVIEYTKE